MADYKIWQGKANGFTGGSLVPYTTQNTVPAPANGDTWGFPNGGIANAFFNTSPGVNTRIWDAHGFAVRTYAFDVDTGLETTSLAGFPDFNIWKLLGIVPDDDTVARYFSIMDGGLGPDDNPSNFAFSRGVRVGANAGAILSGLCIQNCQQAGHEGLNGPYTIRNCIFRKIGVNFATFGGNCIRHTGTTGFSVDNVYVDADRAEDACWAANGSTNNSFKRFWARRRDIPRKQSPTNHLDLIQLLTADGLVMDLCHLDMEFPDILDLSGQALVGSCLITDTVGSGAARITRSTFRSNGSCINLQQANVVLVGNEMEQFNLPTVTAKAGFMPECITLGAGGHLIRGNLARLGPDVQSGTSGFLFCARSATFNNSIVEHNTLVGNGRALKNGALYNFDSTTPANAQTMITRNNLLIDFERGICGTAGQVEDGNAFCNVGLRVTTSITGGVEAGLGAKSKTVPRTAFEPDVGYLATLSSPLIGAGLHTGYKLDARGRQFLNPPDIGRLQRARDLA